jgi:hypothetical protein
MKSYRIPLIVAALAFTAIFCSFTAPTPAPAPTPDVAGMVKATLSALQTETAQAAPPTPASASISGGLGYPSSFIPPLRIYAVDTTSGMYSSIDTEQNQGTYKLDVKPGSYIVFAYPRGNDGQAGGLSGGYTPAVACGLSVNCTDHSLIPVTVGEGQSASGIDIKDWYAPPGTFPAPPDAGGGHDSIPPLGTVTGTLTYPADSLPALRVAFFPLDGSTTSYTDTAAGQGTYTIDLPPGQYHVIAYSIGGAGFPVGLAGGYTQAVPCGLTDSCNDHSLVAVNVVAGTTVTDVNPGDWYAPAGTFPPMPGP